MAALRWPASFQGKIFLLCFVSTHVPLIGVLGYLGVRAQLSAHFGLLAVATGATLLGTGFALYALHGMLEPIRRSSAALRAYLDRGDFPDLPIHYSDDAGQIMAHVQTAIGTIDTQVGRLADVALTDDMTGARNRRWMNEYGIALFESHRKAGKAFGLLVIDLDEFKQINDTYGHSLGDQVILSSADAIAATIRETDHLVRTGGDEFCVFMPGASRADVERVAGRICNAVAGMSRDMDLDSAVTASVGAASLSRKDKGFLDTYRRADRYLYAVKREGRNAVRVAG